ncbi:unnamed protein product [Rangifer tarandus platyrhynchus]|uniref:Uncharacterized protein n=1 Tax=Rangifer tarandus platyrhynchus TaxID=3082113 RepID=A0ABN8XQM4_RANTA|nr:unnamed protein product [Rangifer tarandus platyrhynchus]
MPDPSLWPLGASGSALWPPGRPHGTQVHGPPLRASGELRPTCPRAVPSAPRLEGLTPASLHGYPSHRSLHVTMSGFYRLN